jgi:adenylate cyclase class 2
MKEIEVKILDIDCSQIKEKLLSLGAKKIFEGVLEAIHYTNNQLKKTNNKLRVRKEGEKTILCLKEPLSFENAKIVDEFEIEVEDIEKTHQILEKLGYTTKRRSSKMRISYLLDGTHYDFDKYYEDFDYIPEFLEIESSSYEEILKCAKRLGLEESQLTSLSTSDLIKKYNN